MAVFDGTHRRRIANMTFVMFAGVLATLGLAGGCSNTAYAQDTLRHALKKSVENVEAFVDTCPSESELDSLRRDFPIFTEGQSSISENRPYRCSEPVSEMPREQLSDRLIIYQALRLVRDAQLQAELPWTSQHPYDWLKSRIDGISLRDGISRPFCCFHPFENREALSIVFPTRDRDVLEWKTRFIDPRSGVGLVDDILLLFHETRHVDKPHNCTTCAASNGKGCDTNLEYMGAWAVQYHLTKWIASEDVDLGMSGADQAEYFESELRFRARQLTDRRFCQAVSPMRGMWYDRSHDGHGFDLQRAGDTWFLVLYTYREDGTPEWYLAVGKLDEGVFRTDESGLTRFLHDNEKLVVDESFQGDLQIDFNTDQPLPACDDGVDRNNAITLAQLDWEIRDREGEWCVEPLRFAEGAPTPDFSGHWFSSDDPGWGLTFYQQGDGNTAVSVLYYYDANGQPRWALGFTFEFLDDSTVSMTEFRGYCPGCPPNGVEELETSAGNLSFDFTDPAEADGNRISVDVHYLGQPGGEWQRNDETVQLLSDPAD